MYSPARRIAMLSVLFLIGTSSYIDKNVMGIVIEPIKAEFKASDTQMGLLTGVAFALFYATFGLPVARWADRGNRKIVMTLSLTVWSVMTYLCGAASSFVQLVLARLGVGAGEAGAIPTGVSLLCDYFPPSQRNRAISAFTLSSVAGYALALALGGLIAQHYGWRAVFVILGAAGIVLVPLALLVLQEPRKLAARPVVPVPSERSFEALRILMGRRSYRNLLWAFILYFVVAYGAHIFVVSFMIRAYDLSIAKAGGLLAVIASIAAILGSLAMGFAADKLIGRDKGHIARLMAVVLIAAAPCFQLAFAVRSLTAMLPILFIAEILLTSLGPAFLASMQMVSGTPRRATSLAFASFLANLIGLGGGPVLTGVISDYFVASVGPADSLRYALMIVMTASLFAGIFAWRAARHMNMDAED